MTKKKAGNIFREMSLADVGAELGITAERVRQIEASALYKLRNILKARGIDASLILPPNYDEARA